MTKEVTVQEVQEAYNAWWTASLAAQDCEKHPNVSQKQRDRLRRLEELALDRYIHLNNIFQLQRTQ